MRRRLDRSFVEREVHRGPTSAPCTPLRATRTARRASGNRLQLGLSVNGLVDRIRLCARSRTKQAYGMLDSYQPPSGETLRWVEETLGPGAQLAAVSRLYGGVTAFMDRLTIATNSGRYDVVLRRWHAGERFSGVIDREAAGLTALADHTLPAPRLLGADRSGVESGQPSLLMTALDGEPVVDQADFLDCMPQLVRTLAQIHDIDPGGLAPTDPHPPDADSARGWIKDRALASAVEHAATQASAPSAATLVHGDYQPFNFLCRDGRLTGVVDWAYAGRGWREIDVGHCRLAIAVLFSPDVAELFLRLYETDRKSVV